MTASHWRGTRVARGCALGCVTLCAALLGVDAAGLRVNLSESMPRGLYWLSSCSPDGVERVAAGDVVAVDVDKASERSGAFRFFSDRRYFSVTGAPGSLLLKRVAGHGGDRIDLRSHRLAVNGRLLSEAASTRFSAARGESIPRTPLPATVPAGHLWLTCEHARGIDSRYFGSVSAGAIICVAEPLWVF